MACITERRSARLLDCTLWPYATQQCLRRQPENSLEMTRKMALIDKTDMIGSFADGELACCQKVLRFSHPSLDDIVVRRLASGLFEQLGEVIGTYAYRLSNPRNG